MLTVLTRKAESLKTLSIPTVTIQPTAAVTPPPEPVDETYREMISQIFQRARNREEMSAGVHEAFLAGPIYATKGVTTQPAATVSIQPPAVVVTVIQPVPAASPAPEPIHAVALPKPIVPEPLAPYVEAFSKNTAVTGAVDTEDLTSESTLEDGTALGWKISKTEGRTDSVSWSTTQQVDHGDEQSAMPHPSSRIGLAAFPGFASKYRTLRPTHGFFPQKYKSRIQTLYSLM